MFYLSYHHFPILHKCEKFVFFKTSKYSTQRYVTFIIIKKMFLYSKMVLAKLIFSFNYFAKIIFLIQKTYILVYNWLWLMNLGNLFLCRIFTQDKKLIKCLMDIITDFVWCHVTKWRGGSCGGSNYTALSLHSGLKSEKYCNKRKRSWKKINKRLLFREKPH